MKRKTKSKRPTIQPETPLGAPEGGPYRAVHALPLAHYPKKWTVEGPEAYDDNFTKAEAILLSARLNRAYLDGQRYQNDLVFTLKQTMTMLMAFHRERPEGEGLAAPVMNHARALVNRLQPS